MNEARALRTNLQSARRRHPQASAPACALRFRPSARGRRARIQGRPRTLSRTLTTPAPAVSDLGDGNHCHIAVVDRSSP